MVTVDVLADYFDLLEATARRFVEEGRTALDIMHRGMTTAAVPELVRLRTQFLTHQDHDLADGFKESGCFSDMVGEEQVAAFAVCLELDDQIYKIDVHRRFQPYSPEQPLFQLCPELWHAVRRAELIPTTQARQLGRSGLAMLPVGWGRLDRFLPPELLRWAEATFPGLPLFVRLDPWFARGSQRPEPLREAAVRPVRPDWWRTLALRNGERDGGHYVLQAPGEASPENADEYHEYHVRGVRSLEVHAQRSHSETLSMMIEELSETRSVDRCVIGRCIHLDTNAVAGTDWGAASLKHLDLAINVYFGESASRRRAVKLSDGMVESASVRTHLLRIQEVPFSSCGEFARRFFESRVLFSEWLHDQFRLVAKRSSRLGG